MQLPVTQRVTGPPGPQVPDAQRLVMNKIT